MSTTMTPLVVDLSHHNKVDSFASVYAAGIRGVIHKATEGLAFVDRTYLTRRELVRGTGLLWGAYHFGNASDPEKQAEHFLATVGKPAGGWEGVLLALDWEPNPNAGGEMTLEQAKTFCRYVARRTGQMPVLYSGHLLKEKLGRLADPFLSEHRLWMPQYGPRAVLPPGWERYFLWQYTGDSIGSGPHEIDGISSKGIDLNVYDGTAEELAAEWVVPVASGPSIASTGRTVLAEAEPEAAAVVKPDATTEGVVLNEAVAAVENAKSDENYAQTMQTAVVPSAPAKPPGHIRTAAKSGSIRSLINAKLVLLVGGIWGFFGWLWDWLTTLLDVLPTITGEVGGSLDQAKTISQFLKLTPEQWTAISAAIVVPLIAIAIVRHTWDKIELLFAQNDASQEQSTQEATP